MLMLQPVEMAILHSHCCQISFLFFLRFYWSRLVYGSLLFICLNLLLFWLSNRLTLLFLFFLFTLLRIYLHHWLLNISLLLIIFCLRIHRLKLLLLDFGRIVGFKFQDLIRQEKNDDQEKCNNTSKDEYLFATVLSICFNSAIILPIPFSLL